MNTTLVSGVFSSLWINCACVLSEAAILPGGEEQGDCGLTSENQRAGREPECLQPQWQPSEEEKDLVYLDPNELLTWQPCECKFWHCRGQTWQGCLFFFSTFVSQVISKQNWISQSCWMYRSNYNIAAFCTMSYLIVFTVSLPCCRWLMCREHIYTQTIFLSDHIPPEWEQGREGEKGRCTAEWISCEFVSFKENQH